MKPRFQHDCDNCIFIGHFHNHDVHICPHDSLVGSFVIARYGNDAPDYASAPTCVIKAILEDKESKEDEYVKAFLAGLEKVRPLLPLIKLVDLEDLK